MSRVPRLLDFVENINNPVYFIRLRMYIEKWEAENSSSSDHLLQVIDKFLSLTEIVKEN